MTIWADYLIDERTERQRSRQEYIAGMKAKHGTLAATARAMGVTKSRLWRIISDSDLAVTMAAEGRRNYSWKRRLTADQANAYRVMMEKRVPMAEALIAVGRSDLVEFADPALWAKLQAKMKDAA